MAAVVADLRAVAETSGRVRRPALAAIEAFGQVARSFDPATGDPWVLYDALGVVLGTVLVAAELDGFPSDVGVLRQLRRRGLVPALWCVLATAVPLGSGIREHRPSTWTATTGPPPGRGPLTILGPPPVTAAQLSAAVTARAA
jgi:hypothetical protein